MGLCLAHAQAVGFLAYHSVGHLVNDFADRIGGMAVNLTEEFIEAFLTNERT